jgi:hypothetical protein
MTPIPVQGTSWTTAARTQTCTASRLFLQRTRFVHCFHNQLGGGCDMRRVVQVTRSDLYLLRANKIAVSVTQRSDPAHPQPLHIAMALTCACTDSHPSPRQALSGSISRLISVVNSRPTGSFVDVCAGGELASRLELQQGLGFWHAQCDPLPVTPCFVFAGKLPWGKPFSPVGISTGPSRR